MDQIRVKNLRTLGDSGYIELKKINVLLGRNSSGKSTLARVFPLLKQGAKLKSKSGIIWFGSDVDFGSFQDAKSKSSKKNETIDFTFIKEDLEIIPSSLYFQQKQGTKKRRNSKLRRVEVTAKISEDEKKETSYELKVGDCSAQFIVKGTIGSKFYIENIDLTKPAQDTMYFYRHSGLLPDIYPIDKADIQSVNKLAYETLLRYHSLDGQNFPTELLNKVSIDSLYSKEILARHLKIKSNDLEENIASFIRTYIMWRDFPLIWETIRDLLTENFTRIRYTKPLRASAERYYRNQGLLVDEIDPQGTNLAMFLNDLSPRAAAEFSAWTKEHIGFSIESKNSEGHVSILISDAVSNKTNMADTGFGFSQVAPILAQVWQCTKNRINPTPFIIVIEQPELHLHPHMQSKLASLFSAVASKNPHIKFIIETHSEVFINQLGSAIDNNTILSKDIGIYIFEKSSDSGETSITESFFDENGFLEQWPYGFFDA